MYRALLNLTVLLFLPAIGHADSVTAAAGFIELLKQHFPGSKAACVAEVYGREVNPGGYKRDTDVFAANFGAIKSTKQRFEQTSCFATLAWRLYHLVDEPVINQHRPGLLEAAGVGANKDLSPGWVWEKTKSVAEGDPSLGLALLNVCLNDDDGEGRFDAVGLMTKLDAEAAQDAYQMEMKPYEDALRTKDSAFAATMMRQHDRALDAIRSFKPESENLVTGRLGIVCPTKNSRFFVPGSLGAQTDLPVDVKEAIADVQSVDGLPKEAIPGKYYHVYTSAELGCSLAKCGVTLEEVRRIQDQAAAVYRGIRLCSQNAELLAIKKEIEIKSPNAFTRDGREELRNRILKLTNREALDSLGPNFCEKHDSFCAKFTGKTGTALARTIDNWLESVDAAQLYEAGKIIKSTSVPCSFANYSGPRLKDEDELRAGLFDRYVYGNACRQPGWTTERCNLAARKLRTWEVDELWTRSQQLRGATFGFGVCKGHDSEKSLEARACEIIRKKPAAALRTPKSDPKNERGVH